MSDDNDKIINALIAAGFLAFAGVGVYLVCKAFGGEKKGILITEEQAIEATKASEQKYECYACNKEGKVRCSCEKWLCDEHNYYGSCWKCYDDNLDTDLGDDDF
jgi:hypothetical protein